MPAAHTTTSSIRQMTKTSIIGVLTFLFLAFAANADEARYQAKRAAMVETIEAYARSLKGFVGEGGLSAPVLEAMAQTKRHMFIPERARGLAYADSPLAIGHGQTISQPFIVAAMTELAAVEPGHTVLEIGTGSGYQAAILARLAKKVCTIEIIRPLGEMAARQLRELGYANVSVRIGDGYKGWPECGPFDAVVVTAALGHVPPPLIEQLKIGGRLIMPVGPVGAVQYLTVLEKSGPGQTKSRRVGAVRFVPFTRERK